MGGDERVGVLGGNDRIMKLLMLNVIFDVLVMVV